jgi:hypothetical protein
MTRTRTSRHAAARARGRRSVVFVLDAWNDTDQRSVVAVFKTRPRAEGALTRLLNRPGDWYAGVVRRTIR